MNNADSSEDDHIIVGKINGVYGVKGWVKVFSDTDPKEAISQYNPWYLKQQGKWKAVKIEGCKLQAKTVVAKIEGCDDRNAAMLFTGTEVSIKPEQLKPLDGDRYYWRDLIGLRVRNQQEFDFGTVESLMETGSNDVLVVRSDQVSSEQASIEQGKETLIPWTMGQAVLKVDLEKGEILVDWDDEF